jgi:RNA recognition motif-containing protein
VKNIFVGNLDVSATESSLRALFEPYGKVDRVNVVTDPDTLGVRAASLSSI